MAGVRYHNDDDDSSSTHGSSQSDEEEDEYDMFGGVSGYQFEPVRRHREEGNGGERRPNQDGENEDRLGNKDWCTCLRCVPMATVPESCCCLERPEIVKKVEEFLDMATENKIVCITEHPGFKANCLDFWVLEVAYLQYKQQYQGDSMDFEQNEMYRHTAYRQLVRWCWGVVGRHNRIPLPSCCVARIRETFPNKEGYTGFKWPTLH